ncbi:hypothetical protein [Lacisediminihabitans changchengi]|uniref:Uncharacterized protein n=1 Tax=Lacisediminihabitans changchengi TaxID=2787634 RepID=A0A934W357_9MICO|nr:hypothetical protein [Lacisediminihabitans changchengi]MBK4347566.1 hypothetical protein [Lacisediminihabitans changchengi]
MSFLPITPRDDLRPHARAALDRELELHGGEYSNLRGALLGNLASFRAYEQWFSLRDEIAPWIGERAVTLFAYAISDAAGSRVLAPYFRKILVDAGDDPVSPQVTEAEQLLIDWGRLIASAPHGIPAEFSAQIEATFGAERRLTLLAFAGLTVALAVVTIVGGIPTDDSLIEYDRAYSDADDPLAI